MVSSELSKIMTSKVSSTNNLRTNNLKLLPFLPVLVTLVTAFL